MVMPKYTFKSLKEFFDFLSTAVGYLEKANGKDLGDFTDEGKVRNAGSNNYTVYWDWYKALGYGSYQGEAYCACAVSTMLTCAFGLEIAKKLLCGDLYIYCPDGYTRFKNKNRIFSNPKIGDVVFFWSSSLGRWSHTGIVIKVDDDGKGYTTWEANTSSGNDVVVRNGGATCNKHYTLAGRKVSFGRPDYEGNGISIEQEESTCDTDINIASWGDGITCTTDCLNIRKTPGNGTVIGSLKKGDKVIPSKKRFINGKAWFYIPYKCGWVSANYFDGWIQELDDCGKWWYLLPGYKYYVDQLANIDGDVYYFDSTGYMFIGTITFTTDTNGRIKKADSTYETK